MTAASGFHRTDIGLSKPLPDLLDCRPIVRTGHLGWLPVGCVWGVLMVQLGVELAGKVVGKGSRVCHLDVDLSLGATIAVGSIVPPSTSGDPITEP